ARPSRRVVVEPPADRRPAAVFECLERRVDPLPFVPSDAAQRDARCREIFLMKATALARRLSALPADMRRIVVGVSGGRDSTQALLVAVHAVDLLGLPRTDVVGVTMPGFGTSDRTYRVARDLVRALGARLVEIDVKPVANAMFAGVGQDPAVEDV